MIGVTTAAPESGGDASAIMRTLIRGTLPLTNAAPLIFLLKCLCPEKGQLGEFKEWDRVYNSTLNPSLPNASVRLRTHLPASPNAPRHTHAPRHTLMYFGAADARVPAPCERRAVTLVDIGPEADAILSLLGCVFAFEYMRRGLRFRTRNGIIIDMFTIDKFEKRHDIASTTPLVPPENNHAVIELISEQSATPEELQAFVHHLSPYIHIHAPPRRKMSPKRRLSPQPKPQ
ncbi:hypothetical protein FGB62_211g010 [Gracilaria domingensis]|nr:hypothetical protein FGB62_211g010 [Gracilaria domingensis]